MLAPFLHVTRSVFSPVFVSNDSSCQLDTSQLEDVAALPGVPSAVGGAVAPGHHTTGVRVPQGGLCSTCQSQDVAFGA